MKIRRLVVGVVVLVLIAAGALILLADWLAGEIRSRRDERTASIAAARDEAKLRCTPVGASWSALPGLEFTGSLRVTLPAAPDGAITFVVGDPLPLALRAYGEDSFSLQRESAGAGPRPDVPAEFWLEGAPDPKLRVQRVSVESLPAGERTFTLSLSRRAPRVMARVDGYKPNETAEVCAAMPRIDPAFLDSNEFSIPARSFQHFTTGWSAPETRDRFGPARWTSSDAVLLIPSAKGGAVEIDASIVMPAAPPPGATIRLRLNDTADIATLPLDTSNRHYVWSVPASAWKAGVNELLFSIDGPGTPPQKPVIGVERIDLRLK